ncbi:hypothetical protein LINPERHAP1_LOCUS22674 [Linum perenne]
MLAHPHKPKPSLVSCSENCLLS